MNQTIFSNKQSLFGKHSFSKATPSEPKVSNKRSLFRYSCGVLNLLPKIQVPLGKSSFSNFLRKFGTQSVSVTKGKLVGIATKLPTKSRQANSSIGYFDLNGKTILPYNLKHYLRLTTKLPTNFVCSENKSFLSKKHIFYKQTSVGSLERKAFQDPSGVPTELPVVLRSTQVSNASRSALKSKLLKRLEKSLQKQSLATLGTVSTLLPSNSCSEAKLSKATPSELKVSNASRSESLISNASRSEAKLSKGTLELPWTLTKKHLSNNQTAMVTNEGAAETSLLPHEIKKDQFQKNTWTWLSWSLKNKSPITGRIARSLQRAGLCVLVGGFTAFLPYKEYSIRNKIICAKEAELQSFQILTLKRSNLNCVLSKDRVTYQYDRPWKAMPSELTK